RIGKLYAVEAEIRGRSAEARRLARQDRSAPIIDALKTYLDERLRRLAGGAVTAEAIRYVQSRWEGLTRFLDDGRIELDTNPVERAMRPIALNRKNALFAGSDEGTEHWAILATLIECCKLHGANPTAYLEDVLTRLVGGHLNSRLDELTPLGLEGRSARSLNVKPAQQGRRSSAYDRSRYRQTAGGGSGSGSRRPAPHSSGADRGTNGTPRSPRSRASTDARSARRTGSR
ncbi:MAG: transposase, partial [Alphaproteobacteria bacterium]|nr:transposase [Alphaproteobacteria bacterium]